MTRTATATPGLGPQIVYFGLANSNGCAACNDLSGQCLCEGIPAPTPEYDSENRRVFRRLPDTSFLIVVEAKPGPGRSVRKIVLPPDPATRPDLQIETSRSIGSGDLVPVDCRSGLDPGMWGGVPALPVPDFGGGQEITDLLTDFACRFTAPTSDAPCTLDSTGQVSRLNPNPTDTSVQQFCGPVSLTESFPLGDTVLTVRVRDSALDLGDPAQIVVRIGP